MNDKDRLQLCKDVIALKCSLDYALTRAGGNPSFLNEEALLKMSALEFLSILAPNRVRFHYEPIEK